MSSIYPQRRSRRVSGRALTCALASPRSLCSSFETEPQTAIPKLQALLTRIDAGVLAIAEGADLAVMDPEVAALYAHEVTRETEATLQAFGPTRLLQR